MICPRMSLMKENKIIIVGGNAAGPSAAAKAKRIDPDAEVIMFEAGEFISTGTCELPYLSSGDIDDYKKSLPLIKGFVMELYVGSLFEEQLAEKHIFHRHKFKHKGRRGDADGEA